MCLSLPSAKKVYEDQKIPRATMAERVRHVVQCCFAGRRIVVFSGGENNKDTADLLTNIKRYCRGWRQRVHHRPQYVSAAA